MSKILYFHLLYIEICIITTNTLYGVQSEFACGALRCDAAHIVRIDTVIVDTIYGIRYIASSARQARHGVTWRGYERRSYTHALLSQSQTNDSSFSPPTQSPVYSASFDILDVSVVFAKSIYVMFNVYIYI